MNQSWQTLANPANTVDYSSHLLSATLPISIQHFLKYSETIKKESSVTNGNNGIGGGAGSTNPLNSNNLNLSGMETNGINGAAFNLKTDLLGLKNGVGPNLNLALSNVNNVMSSAVLNHQQQHNQHHHSVSNMESAVATASTTVTTSTSGNSTTSLNQNSIDSAATTTTTSGGKKKKKKAQKEKKPRPKPGEIRETKALDGSTLYCCPECQMAYPERSLIEQHVISHAVERRFVCDICNAALKRKDHLTRHKLSHIPDRPHVCNVSGCPLVSTALSGLNILCFLFQICMKSFKRKEQLTLHIVIHSGEKKHVCQECGKGNCSIEMCMLCPQQITVIKSVCRFLPQRSFAQTYSFTHRSTC